MTILTHFLAACCRFDYRRGHHGPVRGGSMADKTVCPHCGKVR